MASIQLTCKARATQVQAQRHGGRYSGSGLGGIAVASGVALSCWTPALSAQEGTRDASGTAPSGTPTEVVVRKPLLGRSSEAPTTASSTVDREVLGRPGVDAAEALRNVPGVEVARSGASSDFATASIRGATSAQTPVYLGGVRLNDDVGGTADLSSMPVWILHRIEVYRGNAPERADRLGLGGAIFLYPRQPSGNSAGATAELGSFGHRALAATATAGSRNAGVLLGVRVAHADNDYTFGHDGGTRFDPADDMTVARENADYDDVDVWALGRYSIARSRVQTLFNGYAREQGVPGVGLHAARRTRARFHRMLGGLTWTTPCSADGGCRLELSTQALLSRSLTEDPLREVAALLAPELAVSGVRLSQRLRAEQELSRYLTLAPGIWFAHDGTEIRRRREDSLDAQRESFRATLEVLAKPLRWLEVHGFAAGECHATSGRYDDGGCDVLEPTGRAGFVTHVHPSVDVVGNVGRYVRVPTLGEQYGTSPLVRGKEDLRSETGVSVDLGLRTSGELRSVRWAAEAFGFYRDSRHLIAFHYSSLGIIRPSNVGRARGFGAELVAAAEVPHLRVEGAMTALDARDRSADRTTVNDVLPLHARLVVHGRAELFAAAPRLRIARAHLGASYSRRASRFGDPAGLVVLPAQRTVDLDAGVQVLAERLALGLAVRNLFNERFVDILGAPLPGRSLHAALSGQFSERKRQ